MANSNSKTCFQEVAALLSGSTAPRAILVSLGNSGQLTHEPVLDGQSVLNIHTELIDHLDAFPHSTEFLTALHSYCAGRLAARSEAKATGGVSMPRPGGWDIVHVVAQGVQ